ncbi:MAG: hypothetical protein ACOY33_02135 [Pseudomonadota bacterium]
MKHAIPLLTFAAALATALPAAAEETKAGNRHAIGMDLVRLIDHGQFEPDDGTLNLFYQGYLTRQSGWTLGYAWGEYSSIPEITYKIYPQGYQNGSFWQIGAANVDVDNTEYDADMAVLGAFGFERSPAEHVVVSGSVKALVGIDHPRTGEKDIVFLPSLSVLLTF